MKVCHLLVKFILQLFENKANSIWIFGSRKGYTCPSLAWLQGVSLSLSQVGRELHVTNRRGQASAHRARGRGCGVNLGSSVGL